MSWLSPQLTKSTLVEANLFAFKRAVVGKGALVILSFKGLAKRKKPTCLPALTTYSQSAL